MSGFYQMPRGWMNHPALNAQRETFCRRAAFAWLVEEARYTDQEGDCGFGVSQTRPAKRGQVRHHIVFMAGAWGWDEAKVRRFLNSLSTANLIDYNCDGKQPVITIRNYSLFSPERKNSDASATELRSHSEPNLNKEIRKEGKKESPQPPEGGGEPDLFSPSETKGGDPSPEAEQTKKPRRTKEPARFKPKEVAAIVADFAAAYPKGDVPFVFEGPVTNSIDRIVNRDGVDPLALIAATRRYADKMLARGNVGTEYVKKPNNWLRNGDWKAFDGVHFLPNGQLDNQQPDQEPLWKTKPNAWGDVNNPPPWPDAPAGTHCGRWIKTSTRWMFQGAR